MFKEVLRGRVWRFGDNINTDLMMPGFAVLTRPDITPEEAAKYCMHSNRPDWAAQVKPGDIIIGGKNFGCGSSRPAGRSLKALGISIVVAESVARIFFRNCVNLGFPLMVCKGVSQAFDEGDTAEVKIATGEIRNLTTGKTVQGEPLSEDSPPMKILRAGGIMSLLEREYLQGETG